MLERFRDELGDWRLILHSPYGAKVHAPWALAIAARLRERYGGMDVQAMYTDDGIVIRVPDSDDPPPAGFAMLDPDEVEQLVTAELGTSALFASRFRECAARALLLPRRQPGRRSPLWQQRQRAAQLLAVASGYGSFPIVLETMRECLQDVFDVPALVALMRDLSGRRIRLVEVETATGSPFARALLFRYIGAFMYEGDAPLAERRAQALALDSALLAELLGQADLRELLDPQIVAEAERDLQRLSPGRRCSAMEQLADLIREIGPLPADEIAQRCAEPDAAPAWIAELAAQRRIIEVRIAGAQHWAAIEDAGRLRDALGVALPTGIPVAFTELLPDPLGDLAARYARTHGPFTAIDVAHRYGLGIAVIAGVLHRLAADGRVVEGEFLPSLAGPQWCDASVLRMLKRRCLARLRQEVEPVPMTVFAAFLPAWQDALHDAPAGPSARPAAGRSWPPSRRGRSTGPDAVYAVVEQLAGAAVPAGALESLILPARVRRLRPGDARRADRGRRCGLGGRGSAAGRGRLAGAGARRIGAAAAPAAWRDHDDTGARGRAGRAGGRRRAVLPRAGRPGRGPGDRAAAGPGTGADGDRPARRSRRPVRGDRAAATGRAAAGRPGCGRSAGSATRPSRR